MEQSTLPLSPSIEEDTPLIPVRVVNPANQDIALQTFGYNQAEMTILKETAFKELATSAERGAVMRLCYMYQLDPFAKEIYAFKSKGQVVVMISYQGWLTLIKRTQGYKQGSLIVNCVYEKDKIEIDLVSGAINHKQDVLQITDDEDPKGAYCSAIINGQRSTKYVRWSEYTKKGQDNFNPWNKQKSEMICAKACAVFGRVYCGIHGIYADGEIDRPIEQGQQGQQASQPVYQAKQYQDPITSFNHRKDELRQAKPKNKNNKNKR